MQINVGRLMTVVGAVCIAMVAQVSHAWAPVANNDDFTVTRNTTLSIVAPGVLANDTDADGDTLSATLVATTTNGVLTLGNDGGFTYRPGTNFVGADSFRYKASDRNKVSSAATVTITITAPPITVTKPPTNAMVCPGATATFSITATGTGLRYQWRKGSTSLLNQTNSMLVLSNVNAASAGTYAVVVSSTGGISITNSATLTINTPVTATALTNAVRFVGSVVVFNTTASGSGPITYQWLKDGVSLAGKTSSSLVLSNLAITNAGSYSVVVSGPCNSLTQSARLDVDFCFPAVDVALVIDRSGSMEGKPFADAKTASSNFVKNLKFGVTNDRAAIVSYNSAATLDRVLTNAATSLNHAIGALPNANGYTCISCGIATAQAELTSVRHNRDALPVIVILSDGQPTQGDTDSNSLYQATLAKNAGTRIFTVGLGDVDHNLMRGMASSSNDYFYTTNSAQLTDLFNEISSIICRPPTNIFVSGLSNQTVCSGSTVTWSITASNCDAFMYQWHKDGAKLPGQTNRMLTLNDVTASNAGTYTLVVSSSCQTLTNSATLTVNQSLLVTTPPANQIGVVGGTATFSMSAIGTGINYQWRFNGAVVGTNSMLTLNNLTTNQAGIYCAVTMGACGGPITNCAVLTFHNRRPIALPDSHTITEDTTLTNPAPGVLGNDTDPDGELLTSTIVNPPRNGTVVLNPEGSFTYRPLLNFTGLDTFTYRASDGSTSSAPATVTITVTAVNDPPVANNDGENESYRVLEDQTLTIAAPGVLANDTDADGDTLTAVLATGPSHGTVVLNSNGSFSYTPNADYFGQDTFTYRANDGKTNSLPGIVTIKVVPVNDRPSFTAGPNQRVNFDSGPQNAPWASLITPGPGNESTQSVRFNVSTDQSALFSSQPTITSNGVLQFTPAGIGVATITVNLQDDGGTANGGIDTSPTVTFTIALNGPPFVNIISPTNGAVFIGTNSFSVVAEAGDADGIVTNVQIFQGTNVIGSFTNAPYFVPLINMPPQSEPYLFTAIATDDLGLTATSAVVSLVVTQSPPVAAIGVFALNRQNGLFEQYARISNPTPNDFLNGVRLFIKIVGDTVSYVWNATGTNASGIPYIDVKTPLRSGTKVDVLVQYYVPKNRVFPNVILSAEPLPFVATVPPGPTLVTTDSAGGKQFEFSSVSGRIYFIQWSEDLLRWHTKPVPITGTGTLLPANTAGSNACGFYRVLMVP